MPVIWEKLGSLIIRIFSDWHVWCSWIQIVPQVASTPSRIPFALTDKAVQLQQSAVLIAKNWQVHKK